jgi:hypothetical protein
MEKEGDLLQDHRDSYKDIISILETIQYTRNSDKLLIIEVWRKQGMRFKEIENELFFSVCDIFTASSPETIRRVRQKIQNTEGLFLPTDVIVMKRRRINEEKIRAYYSNNPELLTAYNEYVYGIK